MLKSALAIVALFAAAAPAAAQGPAAFRAECERHVRAQLRSDDLRIVAWAAYAAAEHRLAGCVPDLRLALGELALRPKGYVVDAAVMAVLDALVRTDARLAADELRTLDCDAALILMARNPLVHRRNLLVAFGLGSAWLTPGRRLCGNLLAQSCDATFVQRLLFSTWQITVVVNPRAGDGSFVRGKESGCYYRPRTVRKFALPPPMIWVLSTVREPGAGLVADGPKPVLAWRERAGRLSEPLSDYGDFAEARNGWLSAMLASRGRDLELAIDAPRHFVWVDAEMLATEVDRARADFARDWRELLTACVAQRLVDLDPSRTEAPTPAVDFVDRRLDRRQSLWPR